ncbi:MAG: tetratricopeptide repeat protein [Deltaproteobacteria bacterium]|nr:tetratricopeptide repeat protein [Deltaproteobacteria bacterium]
MRGVPADPSRLALFLVLVLVLALGCDDLDARSKAKRAASLYARGRYADAAELYRDAAEHAPEIPLLHLNRGFACLQLVRGGEDRYSECAIEAFRSYLEANPSDPRGREYLVATLVDTARFDDAKAFLEPELSKTPPSLEAISVMARIAQKAGRFEEALAYAEQRARVSEADPAAHQALGALVWDHLVRRADLTPARRLELADRALSALARAAELSPHAPEPWVFRGLVLRERARAFPCGADAGTEPGCMLRDRDLLEAGRASDAARARHAASKDGG